MTNMKDYYIPALAPYVDWVKVHGPLISALYAEHGTVRKTWDAFSDAIPGVEHRLQFDIFEQILLFSLFLSEWNDSNKSEVEDQFNERSDHGKLTATPHQSQESGTELDAVIQSFRKTIDETNSALADLVLHNEQSDLILNEQRTVLENRMTSVDQSLGILINELETQDDHLCRVTQEIINDVQNRRLALVKQRGEEKGPVQSVTQWDQRDGEQPVTHCIEAKVPLKIGKWNVQRSRDGYYRLYRKVGGKVHSIYIGKNLDLDKAEKRIADREKLLEHSRAVEPNNVGIQIKMKADSRIMGDDG